MPIAFLHGLRSDIILIKAPFACRPLDDLIRCSGKVAGHPALIAIGYEITTCQSMPLRIHIGMVCLVVVSTWFPGRSSDACCTLCVARQLGARRQGDKVPS